MHDSMKYLTPKKSIFSCNTFLMQPITINLGGSETPLSLSQLSSQCSFTILMITFDLVPKSGLHVKLNFSWVTSIQIQWGCKKMKVRSWFEQYFWPSSSAPITEKKASFQTLLGAKVVLEGERRIPNEMRKSQHLEVVNKSFIKKNVLYNMW